MLLLGLLASSLGPHPTLESQLAPLTGEVWWDDTITGGGCAKWTFVHKEWGVSLERRYEEREPGWIHDVRVFYNLAVDGEGLIMYAPGWERHSIPAPSLVDGPILPRQTSLGYVMGFCLLEHDKRRLVWTETYCGAETEETPRQAWYRRRKDCAAAGPPPPR